MITSKQRAKLRSMANGIETIVYVGKNGITDELVHSLKCALVARELVKCEILDNAPVNSREAAINVSEILDCEIVQVIGKKFVVYKKNFKKKDGIEI